MANGLRGLIAFFAFAADGNSGGKVGRGARHVICLRNVPRTSCFRACSSASLFVVCCDQPVVHPSGVPIPTAAQGEYGARRIGGGKGLWAAAARIMPNSFKVLVIQIAFVQNVRVGGGCTKEALRERLAAFFETIGEPFLTPMRGKGAWHGNGPLLRQETQA